MLKWLPVKMVDKILLILARCTLGDLEKYGIKRPRMGPIELKNALGKTPVLDVGASHEIKSGKIQIVPGIKKFSRGRVELVNGTNLEIDSVILATGYCRNVPSWLKVRNLQEESNEGKLGLYAVGFSRRGLFGASCDTIRVSQHIAKIWNQETNQSLCHTFL
ncbi:putative indole-3-pyruvate monooxygenase [Helianthus anomalus]